MVHNTISLPKDVIFSQMVSGVLLVNWRLFLFVLILKIELSLDTNRTPDYAK